MKNLLILSFLFSLCEGYEYVYPVAIQAVNNSQVLYVLYQKDRSVELFIWNSETKQVNRVLSKRFFPSQVSIIPDNYGFSFIDQGVIWVKSYTKRSPAHLELPYPIRDIDYIVWKNSTSCYFSALKEANYAIFEFDRYGNLDCLVALPSYDFLYPQKINGNLFCITRDAIKNRYYLAKSIYPHIKHSSRSFNEPVHDFDTDNISGATIIDYDTECKILYSFDGSVAFLKMVSEERGYVITAPHDFQEENKKTYTYSALRRGQNDAWSVRHLFSFSLPCSSTCQTFELVLPFLPRYNKEPNKILYTSLKEGYLTVYEYDPSTGVSRQLSANTDSFAPCYFQDKIIWGGKVEHGASKKGPKIWIAGGSVCLDLPFCSIRA